MQKTAFFLLFILSFLPSSAQNKPKTLLWEVSKPGIAHKSYLFGTFHEVSPAFFLSLTNTVKKLKAAEVVYLEQRFDTPADTAGMTRVSSWNAGKWRDFLRPEQKKVFEEFVSKAEDSIYYQLPPLPLFLSLFRTYGQNFCDTAYTSYNGEIMDSFIEKLALKNKQRVLPLDTDQLRIMAESSENLHPSKDTLLAANAITLMHKMLTDDNSECEFIEDYKKFDLDYQFDISLTDTGLPPQFLLDRNNKWMLILDKSLKKSSCFIAVGLRHLFYREGLVQQLKRLGYTVKPVPSR